MLFFPSYGSMIQRSRFNARKMLITTVEYRLSRPWQVDTSLSGSTVSLSLYTIFGQCLLCMLMLCFIDGEAMMMLFCLRCVSHPGPYLGKAVTPRVCLQPWRVLGTATVYVNLSLAATLSLEIVGVLVEKKISHGQHLMMRWYLGRAT
ncbi:hypothetical protein Tco_0000720 [Tanacetum coccineum]